MPEPPSYEQAPEFDYGTNLALVVDDALPNRQLLKTLLIKNGFNVIEATNGAEAVDMFQHMSPDIIFMDIMMPVMDGYEATAQIKQMSGEKFTPIIFLTALTDELSLSKCINAGGDDFMTKPFNNTILISKINAMRRIQSLMHQTSVLKARMQRDEEMAEKIFSNAVTSQNDLPQNLHTIFKPAGLFSGDIILTCRTPNNDLDILIGDFTGHGLPAAVGALPASEVFHAMSRKGFSGHHILATINKKLKQILPTDMFMAVQFVRFNHEMEHIEVCNCGMPEILILDSDNRTIKNRIASNILPLGIEPDLRIKTEFQYLSINAGDRVILYSDGAIECRDCNGKEFGKEYFEQALTQSSQDSYAIDSALDAITSHCLNAEQIDDISIIEAVCSPELIAVQESTLGETREPATPRLSHEADGMLEEMSLLLTYQGARLRDADPVPAIINFIKNSTEIEDHQALFTVFTELYINALDHGVLGLDSMLKLSSEGFGKYFQERDRRLSKLESGFIKIAIEALPGRDSGKVKIRIEDSGDGFDYQDPISNSSLDFPSGRGIRLVKELCDSVRYLQNGNIVEAIYRWRS